MVYLWLGGSARWPWSKEAAYAWFPSSRFLSPCVGMVDFGYLRRKRL